MPKRWKMKIIFYPGVSEGKIKETAFYLGNQAIGYNCFGFNIESADGEKYILINLPNDEDWHFGEPGFLPRLLDINGPGRLIERVEIFRGEER